jgi:hypothetical protein
MDSVKKELNLKFEHIRYVPLETSDDCLIGNVSKTLIKNNKIYVADFHMASAIFVFDMNGKFLFKIARKGQGPGEYISFHDFDVNSNGEIFIFDQHRKKFLVYNDTGKYQHEINADYYFSRFCLIDNKMYWSDLRERASLLAKLAVYDMTDKTTQFLFKDKKFMDGNGTLNYSGYSFYY